MKVLLSRFLESAFKDLSVSLGAMHNVRKESTKNVHSSSFTCWSSDGFETEGLRLKLEKKGPTIDNNCDGV